MTGTMDDPLEISITIMLIFLRCRREMISNHFEERWENSHCDKMCDRCASAEDSIPQFSPMDVTIYAEAALKILQFAQERGDKVTTLKLLNALLNSGPLRLKDWKYSKDDFNRAMGERLIAQMVICGYLKEDFHFTPYATLSYLVKGNVPLPSSPLVIDFPSKEAP